MKALAANKKFLNIFHWKKKIFISLTDNSDIGLLMKLWDAASVVASVANIWPGEYQSVFFVVNLISSLDFWDFINTYAIFEPKRDED